jgi:predicted nuclease with TOPRIM domain
MKSAENKEQERYILESEIEKLKSEISEISESKNIKEEEYVRLHKIYEDLYQRYEDFKKLRFTDRPDLN